MSEEPPVFWLHLPPGPHPEIVKLLADFLYERRPDAELMFSLAGDGPVPEGLEGVGTWVHPPSAQRGEISTFLEKHKPRAVVWMAGLVQSSLFAVLAYRGIDIHVVDTGQLLETNRRWRFLPRLGRGRFKDATSVTTGDAAAARLARREGADPEHVHLRGFLEPGARAIDCDLDERNRLAGKLTARPIWLAAEISFEELEGVLAAHSQAMRRAHRLVLILVPGDQDDADLFADVLRERGLAFRQRSRGEEPDTETQVYLADLPGEMGLWYRLAPISYVGQTLAGSYDRAPDPFQAAALGSVVIHGPATDQHRTAFARLHKARGARLVSHTGELSYALESLLAADRAAEMASAAWMVTTSDADIANHITELLLGPEQAEAEAAQ